MKANWFKGIRTPDKAKVRWHELCREHHPDNGGDPARMQQIMAEYQSLVTAFAWKEEWEKDKAREQQPPKAQSPKPVKRPKKKKPQSKKAALVQPPLSTQDNKNSTDLEQLIDAGMEFGKLLIKNIVSRKKQRDGTE